MTSNFAIGYTENLPVSDPNCLVERQTAMPELRPKDVLVDVYAVSVNPIDMKTRQTAPAGEFRVLGFDAAGVVKQVGEDVTQFQPGDEVFYAGTLNRPGTNQRYQAVDERIVAHRPKQISMTEAASIPLVALTAWECLFDRLRLTADSAGQLLIVGATGAVGSMMIQLVKALLPKVEIIATASNSERAEFVRGLGADHVVNHRADLAEQVKQVAPDGVQWLFSAYSEGNIDTYAEVVAPFGEIVAIDGGPREIIALKQKSITWHWEFMFTRSMYETEDMDQQHKALEKIAELVDSGLIVPTISHNYAPISAANLRQAHADIETGHTLGKIVLNGWE